MRGINREEKSEALDLLKSGMKPAVVKRVLNEKYDISIPLSTITTWYKELAPKVEMSDEEKRGWLRDLSKDINATEAKIMTNIAPIISEDATDKEYFKAQRSIVETLQQYILAILPKMISGKSKGRLQPV